MNSTSVFKVLEPSVPQLGGQNEFEFGRAGNFDQLSCSSRFFFMRSFLEANDFKNCEITLTLRSGGGGGVKGT